MKDFAVYYLRMATCGLAALLATACVRLAPAEGYLAPQEPHVGQPPPADDAPATKLARTEADATRLDKLERDVAALDSDLTHLRNAIKLMGPLPPSEDFFIPVEIRAPEPRAEAAKPAVSTITMDEFGAGIPSNDIYASAPQLASPRSMFYEAELAAYPSQSAAEAGWKKLAPKIQLTGLEPRFDRASSSVRLSVGPLTSTAAVDALCVDLSALTSTCHVAAPAGAFR
jgi:hypothetical protein